MKIKVLGSGCSKCRSTIGIIERAARDAGIELELVKVERPEEIKGYGVRATPAVVIAGQVVHSGGIPPCETVRAWFKPVGMGFLDHPTRHLFFTGKGGVGKTSLAAAAALMLADAGKTVLLVSTDAASNLDEMLGIELRNTPVPVPGAPGLSVLNIDPDTAAESYRQRVLAQMGTSTTTEELSTVREQLSGACTTEIASFDEFSSLLAVGAERWDHIVFDTAPTGHTLRLLSLPKAWTGFLAGNDRGASCLGPHSGLEMQEARFKAALDALSDPARDHRDPGHPARSPGHRRGGAHLGRVARTGPGQPAPGDQRRVPRQRPQRRRGRAIEDLGQRALDDMPAPLRELPQDLVPLRAFDTVGLPALRALLVPGAGPAAPRTAREGTDGVALPGLAALADDLAAAGHGLIMVMGKGGVGKTTIAAALALGLVQRGKTVHLSTTDPAAHLAGTLDASIPSWRRSATSTRSWRRSRRSSTRRNRPCSGGSAVAVHRGGGGLSCVLAHRQRRPQCLRGAGHRPDRALDAVDGATGAYHRQVTREFEGHGAARVVTPLMRLRDGAYTKIILVTLPEVTPVSQAAALQADLRRAGIEPYAWVLNKSVLATSTRDPLLAARLAGERKQVERLCAGLAKRLFALPWLAVPPIGLGELSRLVSAPLLAAMAQA